jgi:hypothetical protein
MKNQLDLQSFIDKLVSEKREFEGLEPDVVKQIKLDLLGRLEDRINGAIVANIPEDKISQFEKLTESGTDEEVQAFCEENIPDLAQLIASELIVFKQSYLG